MRPPRPPGPTPAPWLQRFEELGRHDRESVYVITVLQRLQRSLGYEQFDDTVSHIRRTYHKYQRQFDSAACVWTVFDEVDQDPDAEMVQPKKGRGDDDDN